MMTGSLLLNFQTQPHSNTPVSQHFQHRLPLLTMLVTTLLFGLFLIDNSVAQSQYSAQSQNNEQRQQYSKAKTLLQQSNLRAYKKLRESLDDYPLAGHLDYLYHRKYVSKLNHQSLEDFAQTHNNILLSNKLKRTWLQYLAKHKQWPTLIEHYDEALANSALQCQYAWALYQSGERQQGLDAAKALWLYAKSRPKSCDAIFHLLIKTKSINSNLAWQRFILAFNARQHQLAKYLIRLLDGPQLQVANQLLKLYRQPHKIPSQWSAISAISNDTLHDKDNWLEAKYQLLKKLARAHPQKAYDFVVLLNKEENKEDEKALAKKLISYLIQSQAIKDYAPIPDLYIRLGEPQDASSIQWLLRAHIAQADWQAVIETINLLPVELQENERWRYWHYRSKSLSGQLKTEEQQDSYRSLSDKASFYGFTTAENLGLPYGFYPITYSPSREHWEKMYNNPYLQRAIEHFKQQEFALARREWRYGSQSFDTAMLIGSAYLAQSIGWHHQAINSAAQAKAWQHYELRFPNLYQQQFEQQASKHGYSARWPYAVARQESALASDAQSSAGAKGLMQLLPSTAKEVAGKKRIRFQRSKLFNSDYNINLGSAYLQQLNKRYKNRALASAAYNAGPRRVKHWLNSMAQPLPLDAWIEIIPFSETRQYVQNIFSFSLIHSLLYSDPIDEKLSTTKDNKALPFIYPNEQMIYPNNIHPTTDNGKRE